MPRRCAVTCGLLENLIQLSELTKISTLATINPEMSAFEVISSTLKFRRKSTFQNFNFENQF